MKKILMVAKVNQPQYQNYVDAAQTRGSQLDVALYQDISARFNSNGLNIRWRNQNIGKYDLVFIVSPVKKTELQYLISRFCKSAQIPIIDPVLSLDKFFFERGKAFDYAVLQQHSLPIIPSWFVNATSLSEIKSEIDFPIVAKITTASQGKGVHLCQNYQELETVLLNHNDDMMLQKFIKNDGDLRLQVIGEEVVGSIKRRSLNKDEFRNNTSLGGEATKYLPNKEQRGLAIKAAKALGYSIAGIDLIKDQDDGVWKIVEVNRAPQFQNLMQLNQIDMYQKIVDYLISHAK